MKLEIKSERRKNLNRGYFYLFILILLNFFGFKFRLTLFKEHY